MEQNPSWGLTSFQLVKKFLAFYGTWRFITAFTRARHLPLSWAPGPRFSMWIFRNKIRFCGENLLAPRPTPKLEDNHLSAFRDCLFNIFAATLHIGGRSSIRNLRTRHAVVTWTQYHGPVSCRSRKVEGNFMHKVNYHYYCNFPGLVFV
jgi:hypothetical protein